MADGDGLIQTIEKLYFENEENFNLDHITNNLPADLTGDYLIEHKERLEKLLNVVSRKVSELILSHQPTYVDELQRIADLQRSITESIRACTQGRSCLRFIKDGAAKNGSIIVEHHRKRESLTKLLNSLIEISDLRNSLLEIKSQEDFPTKIQMCKDGKALLSSFTQYQCLNELGTKLDDTLELIGEQLDNVLSKMFHSFSPNTYAKLQKSYALLDRNINSQALNLFRAYHKSSMDELKMFLENESWEVVPVKDDFKLVQLKEFSFLRNSNPVQTTIQKLTTNNTIANSTTTATYQISPLPLDKISLSSSDDDMDPELNKDFVEEDEFLSSEDEQMKTRASSENRFLLTKSSGPVLTNSSLNVLRLIGRYTQMMSVLEPISYEILMRIYSLLDYYTTVVFKKFSPDDKEMKAVIRSIRESLVIDVSPNITDIMAARDLTLEEPVNPKKAVAVESLIFLVNQLWNLQEYLESLIPAETRPQLREQFTQSHSIVPDFLKARAEMNRAPIIH